MNKTEFIALYAEHQELSKVKAKEIVDTVLAEICNVIADHNSLSGARNIWCNPEGRA